jgi:hypothetical protein
MLAPAFETFFVAAAKWTSAISSAGIAAYRPGEAP